MTSPIIQVYVGAEAYERNQEVNKFAKKHFGKAEVEIMRFDAAERQTPQAIEELMSFSLLAEERIVVLENVETIRKGKTQTADDESASGDDLGLLVNYLKAPRGDTPLLMLAASEKELPAALKKALPKDSLVKVSKITTAKIRSAAERNAAREDIHFEDAAMRHFLAKCGDDAAVAQRELDKLLLWAQPGQTITLADCQRLVQSEEEESIWELTDQVGQRDLKHALAALHHLLDQGHHPVALIAALTGHFRRLHTCKALSNERLPQEEWKKRLNQRSDWLIKKLATQAKQFSLPALRASLDALAQADFDTKGGKSNETMVIERLVIDLCRIDR